MKRAITIILTAVLTLALVSCGGGADRTARLGEILLALKSVQATVESLADTSTDGGPAEETADTPAPGGAERPEETPPAPVDADLSMIPAGAETLKIGLLLNTSGTFADVDVPRRSEFNAMIDWVNAQGGWEIAGTAYFLEPVYEDGRSDASALRAAALRLADAGVRFVVETDDLRAGSCADIFEDAYVLHASVGCAGSGGGYLIPENPLAFTGAGGTAGDLRACLAVFGRYYPDVKTVVYAGEDGDEIFSLLTGMAAACGVEVVGCAACPGGADYDAWAVQLVDTGADGIVCLGSPEVCGALLKAVRGLDSGMVVGCARGIPAAAVRECAGGDAGFGCFTLGPSARKSDRAGNTRLYNELVDILRARYGEDAAASFDGAAANTLYTILQMMRRAGSLDPLDAADAWTGGGEVDSLYGPASVGGTETYGVVNHAVGTPRAVSILEPEAEDGWGFAGWIAADLP